MKLYLVFVWGDVEPEVAGPFDSEAERDAEAGRIRAVEGDENGVYKLDIGTDGTPSMNSYSGGHMEELTRPWMQEVIL